MNLGSDRHNPSRWPDYEKHRDRFPYSSRHHSLPLFTGPSSSAHRSFEFDFPQSNQVMALPDGYDDNAHVIYHIPESPMDRSFIPPFFPPLAPHSLPVYSASGFDMLRILAKVAMRPNPRIMLGPVDLTCSFVVADARQPDNPIVYASPTFFRLTGYCESEVRGRNCRFLQSPSGNLQRGDPRLHTAPDAVRHLYRSILQDKECQASLINYRKDGAAFVNLVTVIPISEDDSGETTHFVGFQVDLAEQPGAILQKLRDGSYIVNYSATAGMSGIKDRKGKGVSADLLKMTKRCMQGITGKESERAEILSLLTDNSDDFIHVLSLKGSLLYMAPSITRVLGYTADEFIGRSIADLCHPADIVPVMRELKDASSMPVYQSHISLSQRCSSSQHPLSHTHPPLPPSRPTSLLFRARHKNGEYVWLLSRGRLHVEPGKGRKAVILVGRRIEGGVVPIQGLGGQLEERIGLGNAAESGWGLVAPNGIILSASRVCTEKLGFRPPLSDLDTPSQPNSPVVDFHSDPYPFAIASGINPVMQEGHHMANFSTSGQLNKFSAVSVPGLAPHVHIAVPAPALVGQTLTSLVSSSSSRRLGDVLAAAACAGREEVRKIRCRVKVIDKEQKAIDVQAREFNDLSLPVEFRFYAREHNTGTLPTSLVFEMVFLDGGDTDDLTEVDNPTASPTESEEHFGMRISHPIPRQTVFSTGHSLFSGPSTTTQDQQAFSPLQASFSSSSSFTSCDSPAASVSPIPQPSPTYSHPSSVTSFHSITKLPLLSALSTSPTTEASWQYELTRLRFENERMRAELMRLQRTQRKANEGECGILRSLQDPPLPPLLPLPSLKRSRGD